MKNLLTCLLVCLGPFNTAMAQCPSPDESYNLNSQSEVEEFLTTHPDCEYVFELDLSGDINDVSGFSTLRTISYLYINNCPQLSDLSGFHNIDTIYGNLGLENTLGMTDLCGFNNLNFIGQDLRLEETTTITSLHGLESLTNVGDDITIQGNVDLENLNGLENISSIGDNPNSSTFISIEDNPRLDDCCGLQNLYNTVGDINWDVANNAANCIDLEAMINAECNIISETCSTSTKDVKTPDVIIMPNPIDDYIRIENTSNVQIDEIHIYRLDGIKILETSNVTNSIPVRSLNEGVYILTIKTQNNIISKKIVVKR